MNELSKNEIFKISGGFKTIDTAAFFLQGAAGGAMIGGSIALAPAISAMSLAPLASGMGYGVLVGVAIPAYIGACEFVFDSLETVCNALSGA